MKLPKDGETYSKVNYVTKASAVAALTRASAGTITIPAGHDGRLRKIRAMAFGTIESIVDAGGLVEIECDSPKITCQFVVGGMTCVTEGGAGLIKPQEYEVDFPQKGGSTYTIWYTPYDNQSQSLEIELEWEVNGNPDETKPNFMMANMVLKANAVAAITVAEAHNTINLPADKGGILLGVEIINFPTLETAVDAGGKVVLNSDSDDWKPFEMIVHGLTALGASGGAQILPYSKKVKKTISGKAKITSDFTPYDDQSQSLGLTILWRSVDPN